MAIPGLVTDDSTGMSAPYSTFVDPNADGSLVELYYGGTAGIDHCLFGSLTRPFVVRITPQGELTISWSLVVTT